LLIKPTSKIRAKMAKIRNKLRDILSVMCLDLTSANDINETENNEVHFRRHIRTKPAETPCYARNTLMGLPTELRLIIYDLVLQDVTVRQILRTCPAPGTAPTTVRSERSSQHSPLLGGLALPRVSRTVRQDSLDVYTRLLKTHEKSIWDMYIDLQNMAKQALVPEQSRLLDAEVDAFLHWCAAGDMLRRIECMY
jgi:hypothetical protein